jgi:hypothetical protein
MKKVLDFFQELGTITLYEELTVCSSVWSEFSVWNRVVAGSNPATQTNLKSEEESASDRP